MRSLSPSSSFLRTTALSRWVLMAAGALLRKGLDRAVPLGDRQPGSLQDVVRPGLVRAQPDADYPAPVQLVHGPLDLPAPEGGPLLGDRPERGVDVAAD